MEPILRKGHRLSGFNDKSGAHVAETPEIRDFADFEMFSIVAGSPYMNAIARTEYIDEEDETRIGACVSDAVILSVTDRKVDVHLDRYIIALTPDGERYKKVESRRLARYRSFRRFKKSIYFKEALRMWKCPVDGFGWTDKVHTTKLHSEFVMYLRYLTDTSEVRPLKVRIDQLDGSITFDSVTDDPSQAIGFVTSIDALFARHQNFYDTPAGEICKSTWDIEYMENA